MRRSDQNRSNRLAKVIATSLFFVGFILFLVKLPLGNNKVSQEASEALPLISDERLDLLERIGSQITPLHQATPIKANPLAANRSLANPRLNNFAKRLREMREQLAQKRASSVRKPLKPVSQINVPNPLAPKPVPLTVEQKKVVSRLRASGARDLKVRAILEQGTIRFISGLILEPAASVASGNQTLEETTANNFLDHAKELLLIEDPTIELRITDQTTDELGYTQVRYEQTYQDLEVWPANITVQLRPNGHVGLLTGGYAATPTGVDTVPTVNAEDAFNIAVEATGLGQTAEAYSEDLIIYAPMEDIPHLAYRFGLRDGLIERWSVTVHAHTGEVSLAIREVYTGAAFGSGLDLDGQIQPLNIWSEGGLFYLVDTSKTMFDPGTTGTPTLDTIEGIIKVGDAGDVSKEVFEQGGITEFVTDTDSFFSDNPDAISAAVNLATVYDYYLTIHGRDSFDGEGSNLAGIVNLYEPNAFWYSALNAMVFGNLDNYANALDVVAHEVTHGVIDSSAKLIYKNQSGALSEAFADIFGESAEAFANASGQPDWLMGSKLDAPLRNMEDPSSFPISGTGRNYPSRMSEYISLEDPLLGGGSIDHGGVHYNSSIINHAFYLLSEGLEGAIGIVDAGQIFYRTLTTKLSARSQFLDCRLACVASAEELFGQGSVQALKTGEAFDRVEIFDQVGGGSATAPIPAVNGDDAVIFTFENTDLGRWDPSLGDPSGGVVIGTSSVANGTRPSVTGDGQGAVFVTQDYDMAIVDLETGEEFKLGYPGFVHSVSISPDGNSFAFVFRDLSGFPDNRIFASNFVTNEDFIYDLVSPVLDGGVVNTVSHANTLAFSPDGRFLFYDAVNILSFTDGSTSTVSSLYVIDQDSANTFSIFPPEEGFSLINPALGKTRTELLTFEVIVDGSSLGFIFGLDLFSGQADIIYVLDDISEGLAFPGYNGDDTEILFTKHVSVLIFFHKPTLRVVPLDNSGIIASGPSVLFRDRAKNGVAYRRGDYIGLPVLSVTATDALAEEGTSDFGEIVVSRMQAGAVNLPFSLVWVGGARAGIDYLSLPLTGTIPAGNLSASFTIVPIDDQVEEFDKVVSLVLQDALHYTIGDNSSATVVIVDDDAVFFEFWALENNVAALPENDPDNDGFSNLAEYALGLNPLASDGAEATFLTLTSDTGQQYLTLEVNRFKKRLDIDYIVEVSENLSDWFSGPSHTIILEDTPTRLV